MGATRRSSPRIYTACLSCKQNTDKIGVCKAGYDNFFKRKTKDNGCPIVQAQRTTCPACQNRIVMPAFSENACSHCGAKIISANTPAPELCVKCAMKLGRCAVCGRLMH